MFIKSVLFLVFTFFAFTHLQAAASLLPSTESDPDAFIDHCAHVITGDYCETVMDLSIAGPDPLVLQRYYNAKNYMTGKNSGGWRIFPQILLVTGRDPENKECTIEKDRFEWVSAFTGERSGGILSYSGWRKISGDTKDPLKIDPKDTVGMVNSYAGEMNGQTNHLNNHIHFKQDTCELQLGDGTKRLYKKVNAVATEIFGEEMALVLASKVIHPQYFLLLSETLPSGNVILFSYDEKGHIARLEMKDALQKKSHSWIRFNYDFNPKGCRITASTSDEKRITYNFERLQAGSQSLFALKEVNGSHSIPCFYDYEVKANTCFLVKKRLPEGRFLEIGYDEVGRVKALKGPTALSDKPDTLRRFVYGDKYTDVTNAVDIKTRYIYDDRLQLIAIEQYDQDNTLYRSDKKYYGKTKQELTFLLARTITDGAGRIHSYRCFKYDNRGNVLEEKLYGNLTGKKEVFLQVDANGQLLNPDNEECHIKTFSYSQDGFNLVTCFGDCKGNKTTYNYENGSNRLSKKFIYNTSLIRKREFRFYNEDAVCIKITEDNDNSKDSRYAYIATDKYITEIHPKETLPGVGLAESIEEKAFDFESNKEILVKKLINIYSSQGHLLSCATYDSNGTYAYTIAKAYNHLGQVTSETDLKGQITTYSYDCIGNQILISIPHQNKTIEKKYDLKNNLLQIIDHASHLNAIQQSTYDALNRQISSIDRFGQITNFEYDTFDHLIRVIYPTVLDEYEKPFQPTFTYTYDIFGNVLTTTDPKGYTIKKTYNLRGSPSHISYPDGSVEMFKYDTEGSLHRSITRDQIITVYEYDYLGRVTYEEDSFVAKTGEPFITGRKYGYNSFYRTYSALVYLGYEIITHFRHDSTGKVISIVKHSYGKDENDPQSRKTEIFYDTLGRENKKKVWYDIGPSDYSVECCEYDLIGNITEKRIEDATGKILVYKGFAYDDSGHCIEEYAFSNDLRQAVLKTRYDPFGEPISYTDASGHESKVLVEYGKNALRKTIINPEGVQTLIEFDALGRVVSIIKKDSKNIILSSQAIFYDSVGNKSLEINAIITDGLKTGLQKTRWVYGPMGRIEKLIEAEGTLEEKRTTYSYNTFGKLVSKTLPGLSSPITYTYSKEGWLTKVQYADGKNDPILSNSYSYDKQGNIASATGLNGTSIQRSYDIFQQITEETINDGEGKYTLKFQYDRRGRLKSINLPDASAIIYTYDGIFGRKVKRISPEGKELYLHNYSAYDESGRLLEETLIGSAGGRKVQYDANGRKTAIETDYFKEIVPKNGYNTVGNLLNIQRKGDFPTENGVYTYNALSQLTSEKNGISKIYSYDSIDNRRKENNEELLYNDLNQLIAKAKTAYAYDTQGNLLRKTLDVEETKFESNILSELIAIEQSDKTFLTFSYDPFGRRLVKKTHNSNEKNKKTLSITRSFYLGHHELGILDKKNNIKKLRISGISGETLSLKSIAIEINDQVYAVLHDISGNVCAILDPITKKIVESYTYSAFGNEKIFDSSQNLIFSSKIGNHWRYAEKPIDEETGLIYFGLRYYDPSIGRWISKDPAGFVDGPNLYANCHNNPFGYFDRFGLESESVVDKEYFYGNVESHCYCERHRTCKRGGDLNKTTGSNLPKVLYCDSFESFFSIPGGSSGKDLWASDFLQPEFESSKISTTDGWEIADLGIGFINGVLNNFNSANDNARYLSNLASGYNIHYVCNATHGPTGDTIEYLLGRGRVATEPVRLLHKMWNSFFETRSSSAKFLMFCHSQGTVHVKNALLDYPPELRERISVVAIAPGAYIYRKSCSQITHYRNASVFRDFVSHLDWSGAKREKDTIVDLVSHPEADFFDHSFQSLTYRRHLIDKLNNFIK